MSGKPHIQCQLKLRPCKSQEREMERYLYHLASVWNWASRKIELNAANKIYFGRLTFSTLLAGHSDRLGIQSHVLQGVLKDAHLAWQRCFRGVSRKPRLKGARNRLNSISFPDPIAFYGNRAALPGLGRVRFHKMQIPEGVVKSGRLCKRASGWYLCLFIEAVPQAIPRLAAGKIGIDPGFSHLLTTSDGEVIEHPRELEAGARRLAQAQRGHDKQLAARIQERIGNRRGEIQPERKYAISIPERAREIARECIWSGDADVHGQPGERTWPLIVMGWLVAIYPTKQEAEEIAEETCRRIATDIEAAMRSERELCAKELEERCPCANCKEAAQFLRDGGK